MRRIVVSQFVTVDGVMDEPGHNKEFERGGWAFAFDRGPEGDAYKMAEMQAAGALLLGRVTYEGFAAAWPSMTDEEGFADKMNGMKKYVVSSTLNDPTWNNTTVISGDIAAEIAALRQGDGDDILVNGSGQLVHLLAEHNLVDEYRLMVYPIILGAGKRLFADTSQSAALRLTEARPVGTDGVSVLTYRPKA